MKTGFEAPRFYLTDDCDLSENRLEMFMGGNGDWYVTIRFRGRDGRWRSQAVRITTSGQRREGMLEACAKLYRAMDTRVDDGETEIQQ